METGSSNGMMMVLPIISVRVITTMPTITTQHKLDRSFSHWYMETRLETTQPRQDSIPTTTENKPVVMATMELPLSTTARYLSPTEVAISSPRPATVKRSAIKYTTMVVAATIHSSSYRPRVTPVKDPANQMPRFCSMSVCRATNVETEPTTAPSMSPTMSTTRDDFRATRCRNAKKMRVPTMAKTMATSMRSISDGWGTKI